MNRSMQSLRFVLLQAAILTALPSPGWSAVVFTNLGAGGAFNTGLSYAVGTPQFVAADFSPSATGALTSLTLALGDDSATVNLLVSLRAPGTDPTGVVLESWTLTPAQVSDTGALSSLISVQMPTLTAGVAYWVRLESVAPLDAIYMWYPNSTGDLGLTNSLNQGSSWSTTSNGEAPAFEVNADTSASSVPEPSTALFLLSGLAAFAWQRSRRVSR